MSCHFLSIVILFLFMHNRERQKVEETKQYNRRDDKMELGIDLTRAQSGFTGIAHSVTYF